MASGPPDVVAKWKQAGRSRILPATPFDPKAGKPSVDELRQMVRNKQVVAFAEVGQQYDGIPANDPRMEPYYSLAEELDVPVGIHMGPGPPGATDYFAPEYRMRISSLLLLEDVLVRHPKLRLWAMHAGWPLGDDAIGALYAHPQLYVDIGIIDHAFPRKEFYSYLRRLIDAGFENRIMFGSDEMVWPDALSAAIDTIQDAPFLTQAQKRDILYNNAARFLRLKQSRPEVFQTMETRTTRSVNDRSLFLVAGGVVITLVVLGFGPTYFYRPFIRTTDSLTILVHVHGALMTAWTALFVVQVGLAATGRIVPHRQLGQVGFILLASSSQAPCLWRLSPRILAAITCRGRRYLD